MSLKFVLATVSPPTPNVRKLGRLRVIYRDPKRKLRLIGRLTPGLGSSVRSRIIYWRLPLGTRRARQDRCRWLIPSRGLHNIIGNPRSRSLPNNNSAEQCEWHRPSAAKLYASSSLTNSAAFERAFLKRLRLRDALVLLHSVLVVSHRGEQIYRNYASTLPGVDTPSFNCYVIMYGSCRLSVLTKMG